MKLCLWEVRAYLLFLDEIIIVQYEILIHGNRGRGELHRDMMHNLVIENHIDHTDLGIARVFFS